MISGSSSMWSAGIRIVIGLPIQLMSAAAHELGVFAVSELQGLRTKQQLKDDREGL
jgi:hypothetical protein